MKSDRWYKRDPRDFLEGVQGMGPDLIGAYAVILDILYARHGEMPRDDRHLAGVLGCSIRKARSLTEQLLAIKKIEIEGGNVVNRRALREIKERETNAKPTRNQRENSATLRENNNLARQRREEENITPLTPQGGMRRKAGVPQGVIKLLNGDG